MSQQIWLWKQWIHFPFWKALTHCSIKKTSYANGEHTHTSSIAFFLSLPCKHIYFCNGIILETYKTDKQKVYGSWPRKFSTASLDLHRYRDSSMHQVCLESCSVHTHSAVHPHLAWCYTCTCVSCLCFRQSAVTQHNSEAKTPVQKLLSTELELKVCVLMESLHAKCVIATREILLLLITNAS